MTLLLDTHTLLWFLSDATELSATAKEAIESHEGQIWVSVASLWEIVIKLSTGKLSLSSPFASFIDDQLALNKIGVLPIRLGHVATVARLPLHHRDPFDRMIIAQAMGESATIVGRDRYV
jgi:PIN domain nuclease of toxin-antitoxin system